MSTEEIHPGSTLLSSVELSADAVLNRMKDAWKAKTDASLAQHLRTARQNITKWRSRNSVPYAEAVLTSYVKGVSLDWLLKGEMIPSQTSFDGGELSVELIRAALVNLVGMHLLDIRSPDEVENLTHAAKSIAAQYKRAQRTRQLLMSQDHMSGEEAQRVAVAATEMISSDGSLFGPRLRPKDKRSAPKGPQ